MVDNNGLKLQESIQSQIRREDVTGLDIFPLLLKAGELIPPWWSTARDWELSRFWPRVDHVASAFGMFTSKTASIPLHIRAKDTSIKAHVKQAEYYQSILVDGSDFGKGWHTSLAVKLIEDWISQDNGMFAEVIADAPMIRDRATGYLRKDFSKPREGPPLGFAHLDAQRCARTSSPEFPVLYQDIDGNRYKLHRTRVIFASDMPSTRVRMNEIGYCALTRMINTAQHLLDISTMEQEELGSRPKRRFIVAKQGITAQQVHNAFQAADTIMDNRGLTRFSQSVVIGLNSPPTSANAIEIEVKDLHAALLGEDKERSVTLGMFLIALALKIPPRWLWPATSTGATKADAMYQHIAGMGGGVGHLLKIFQQMLGGDTLATAYGKPIPSYLEISFDEQDDEQDRTTAEIKELRSKTYSTNLATGAVNERVIRQQMLAVGDLTQQQYEDLELQDGRLSDGQDVLNLFYSTEPALQTILSLSVGDVLNPQANDRAFVLDRIQDKELELRAILQNPSRPKEFETARLALAALMALKKLYTQPIMEEQQEGLAKIQASEKTPEVEDGNQEPDQL